MLLYGEFPQLQTIPHPHYTAATALLVSGGRLQYSYVPPSNSKFRINISTNTTVSAPTRNTTVYEGVEVAVLMTLTLVESVVFHKRQRQQQQQQHCRYIKAWARNEPSWQQHEFH